MPAVAAITINDGATTPVAHTFTPIGKDDKGVLWYEQTTPTPASPVAAKRIGIKHVRGNPNAAQANTVSKLIISLAVPTMETLGTSDSGLTPPPTLAYKQVARLEMDMPERGATQERKDTRVLLTNLLGSGTMQTVIDQLQPIYGG